MRWNRHWRVAPHSLILLALAAGCGDAERQELVASYSMAAKPSKPTVTITAPSDGATVAGTVDVSATATSSSGIASVDFYVDGALAFQDTTSPYGFPWDTTQTANGNHTLSAQVNPTSGTPATNQISVVVNNELPPVPAYAIGGTVSGLSGIVVLQNNGGDNLSLSADGTFAFSTAVNDGAAYDVTVLSQPAGQTCTVADATGSVAGADVTNVAVSCADNPPESGVQIKLGSFNIENFGTSKAGKPAVMQVLVNIALRYDVLLIQELSNVPDSPDDTGPVIRQYLSEINAASGNAYAMAISSRVGGTQAEQYVMLYRTQSASVLESSFYADPTDAFVREPFLTRIQVGDENFYISNVHTAPDFAQSEIYELTSVAHSIDGVDPDIVLLGDWNADGSYFNENTDWSGFGLLSEGYEHRIADSWDTTVLNTDYTYDRIMLSPSLQDNDIPGSAKPFYFDDPANGGWDMTPILDEGCSLGYLACGATYQDAARRVSDHYPVEITLQFGGTIGPPPPPPPPPTPAYSTSFEDGEPDFEKVSGAGTFYPDTCPAGTTPRTGTSGISNSSITTSYSGRAIQSVDCLPVPNNSLVDASYWITASTNNGGNGIRGRITYLWFTDDTCTTAHATPQTSAPGVVVPEGSYVQVSASEAPPDATAGYFKIRAEVIDDNGGTNTEDDWCIDDVVISQ